MGYGYGSKPGNSGLTAEHEQNTPPGRSTYRGLEPQAFIWSSHDAVGQGPKNHSSTFMSGPPMEYPTFLGGSRGKKNDMKVYSCFGNFLSDRGGTNESSHQNTSASGTGLWLVGWGRAPEQRSVGGSRSRCAAGLPARSRRTGQCKSRATRVVVLIFCRGSGGQRRWLFWEAFWASSEHSMGENPERPINWDKAIMAWHAGMRFTDLSQRVLK